MLQYQHKNNIFHTEFYIQKTKLDMQYRILNQGLGTNTELHHIFALVTPNATILSLPWERQIWKMQPLFGILSWALKKGRVVPTGEWHIWHVKTMQGHAARVCLTFKDLAIMLPFFFLSFFFGVLYILEFVVISSHLNLY